MNYRTIIPALVLALAFMGCDGRQGGPEPGAGGAEDERKALVRVIHPESGSLRDRLEITARVEAFERADIVPRIDGTILEILAEEGDEVKLGQILARIECEEDVIACKGQELAVEQAALAVKQAELVALEANTRVETQRVTIAREERTLTRSKSQHAKGIVTDQELETSQYAFDTATAEETRLQVMKTKSGEDLEASKVAERSAKNMLKATELRCRWAEIRSTITGRITKRHVRVGQKTSLAAPAFSVADFDSLVIRPTIPEKELRLLRPGLTVELETAAYPGVAFKGRLVFIASEVDVAEGAVETRISIPGTEPPLLPGMFVSGHIITETRENILLVPKKALLFDRDRPYLFVLERNEEMPTVARKVFMRRGLQSQDTVEFLPAEGSDFRLTAESEIVLVGLDRLFDGAVVTLEGEDEDEPDDEANEDPEAEESAGN